MLDDLDREILLLLQNDGRMSLTDLAERVGLTLSPAHRRVRRLETEGAISGYRAMLNPEHLDLGLEMFVFVSVVRHDAETIEAFEDAVAAIPEVLDAKRLLGDPDYLLRVRTPNLEEYTAFTDRSLFGLPGVQRISSTPVMKNVVDDRPYPV